MEISKLKAIAKAYGEHWEKVKDFVDENGWFDMKFYDEGNFEDEFFDNCDVKNAFIRPKSLAGIENNNGWIKIESEADLPKKGTSCHVILKSGVTCVFIDLDDSEYLTLKNRGTHYQPIVKPEPPIY